MQNQGEDQPCRIKLEGLPTKHQVPNRALMNKSPRLTVRATSGDHTSGTDGYGTPSSDHAWRRPSDGIGDGGLCTRDDGILLWSRVRGLAGSYAEAQAEDGVPALTAVAQRRRRRIGQSGRVIGRSPSEPSCVPRNSSRTRPPRPEPASSGGSMKPGPPRIVVTTPIDIENAAIRTAKPAVYPGTMGKDHSSLNTRNG